MRLSVWRDIIPLMYVVGDDDEDKTQGAAGAGADEAKEPAAATTAEKSADLYTAKNLDELGRQILSRRMKRNEPMTDADLAKLRKRQKARKIMAGITDLASNLANMWGVYHYAPNMYDPSGSMSLKARERYAQEEAARQKREDLWVNDWQSLRKFEQDAKEYGLRVALNNQKIANLANEDTRDKEKHAWEAELQPYKVDKAKSDADAAGSRASKAATEAEWEPKLKNAELTQRRASANSSNASAALSNARRENLDKHGFTVTDEDGNEVWIDDDDIDYHFSKLPENEQKKAGNTNGLAGYNKPNKDQKKTAIANNREKAYQAKQAQKKVNEMKDKARGSKGTMPGVGSKPKGKSKGKMPGVK